MTHAACQLTRSTKKSPHQLARSMKAGTQQHATAAQHKHNLTVTPVCCTMAYPITRQPDDTLERDNNARFSRLVILLLAASASNHDECMSDTIHRTKGCTPTRSRKQKMYVTIYIYIYGRLVGYNKEGCKATLTVANGRLHRHWRSAPFDDHRCHLHHEKRGEKKNAYVCRNDCEHSSPTESVGNSFAKIVGAEKNILTKKTRLRTARLGRKRARPLSPSERDLTPRNGAIIPTRFV